MYILKKLSIKNRWIILLIGAFVFMSIVYKLNIKKTLVLLSSYKELKQNVSLLSANNNTQIINKENKVQALLTDNTSLIKGISDYIAQTDIAIQEISRYDSYIFEDIIIETNKLTVKGNYSELMDFIYYLEYVRKIATINSIVIEMSQDKTTDVHTLVATLYIKCILYEKNSL